MNRMLLCIFLTCFCLQAWAAGNKDLYKCLVNGKVRYTDQIPNANAKCVPVLARKLPATASSTTVQSGESGKASADNGVSRQANTSLADKELEAKRKKLSAEDAKAKEEQKLAQQQTRDNNCRNAKINIQTLQLGRVSRVNEKKERYYLDDATIANELAQARKDAEEWCNK
jgi:hypothetical protein